MNKRIKKKLTKNQNIALIGRYPFLLPRNVWNDSIDKDYHYTWTLADDISPGWRKAFGTQLFEELRNELVRCNYLDEFHFIQIKEKYGYLRLYCGPIPAESKVSDILDKYERLSETICEHCGRPNQQIINYRGWLQCICPGCLNHKEDHLFRSRYIKEKQTYQYFLKRS